MVRGLDLRTEGGSGGKCSQEGTHCGVRREGGERRFGLCHAVDGPRSADVWWTQLLVVLESQTDQWWGALQSFNGAVRRTSLGGQKACRGPSSLHICCSLHIAPIFCVSQSSPWDFASYCRQQIGYSKPYAHRNAQDSQHRSNATGLHTRTASALGSLKRSMIARTRTRARRVQL